MKGGVRMRSGTSVPRRHLLENRIFVDGINVGKVYRALEGVLVIVRMEGSGFIRSPRPPYIRQLDKRHL